MLHLAFDRSVGGATGAFLAGLADRQVWGSRGGDGRVSVPPREGDEPVRVADTGVVRAWSWVPAPEPGQPLPHPFAYALVQLDGADTSLLHVVDTGSEQAPATGQRVRADWRPERSGSVLDIRAFVPDPAPAPQGPSAGPEAAAAGPAAVPEAAVPEGTGPEDAPGELHVELDRVMPYTFEPGLELSRFYRALAEGRIEGGRCPSCDKVYVPPHPRCPACGSAGPEVTEVAGVGVVESVTVVHLPMAGLDVELPFTWARVLLDGADVSFPHLIGEVAADGVEVGRRVEAVWRPDGERPPSWEAISHFRPVVGG